MRNLRRVAGLLLAGLLPACGGSSTPTSVPTPAPTPTPCTQSVLIQVNGSVPSRSLGRVAFSAAMSGRLDITVDWTFATSPIGVYLVGAQTCPIDSFNANTCTFLARSETTVKPRKISVNVSAGNYELLVANFAAQDESISGQVVLSSATCPAFASAGPAATLAGARGPLTEAADR
jgi:hypothetical protein